jgi:hypothetical protein
VSLDLQVKRSPVYGSDVFDRFVLSSSTVIATAFVMTLDPAALLDQFNALCTQLSALEPPIAETITLAEVRTQLTTRIQGGKAAALALLDQFLALQHEDQGEFAPLNDYKSQVRTFRKEVEAIEGALSKDAQNLVNGTHPVAQLLQAVKAGETLSDAQWSNLQTLLTKVFGSPIAVAVSRGKLVIAPEVSEPATKEDGFLWGDRVPLPSGGAKSSASAEPPIVFGAKSLGIQTTDPNLVPLRVEVHIQNVGDRQFGAGEFAGTRGQSLAIEGLSVALVNPIAGLEIEYMAHVAQKGDLAWVRNGQYAGTRGESLAVEGFAMRLSGPEATNYELTYSAHVQNIGDVPPQSNGSYCGTRGRGLKVEGLTVYLRKK